MVASGKDAKGIADIMCLWMPSGYCLDMVQEIWNDIGVVTENESLRDSILLVLDELENYEN